MKTKLSLFVLVSVLVMSSLLFRQSQAIRLSCVVTLPSVIHVGQSYSAGALLGTLRLSPEGGSAAVGRLFLGIQKFNGGLAGGASECSLWNQIPCLSFTKENLTAGQIQDFKIKIPWYRVPQCTPGESIPLLVRSECRLGPWLTKEARIISLKCRRAKVMLQLDKPVYSAGQRVRVRGFFVDDDLHSVSQKVVLEIRNPRGALVALHTFNNDEELEDGVIDYFFKLDDEPQFGFWSVLVRPVDEAGVESVILPTRTTFEVKDYVLPKFSVEVNLPDVLTEYSTAGVPVSVAAMYTYSAAVNGSVKIEADIVYGNTRRAIGEIFKEKSLQRRDISNVEVGEASFVIPTHSIKTALGYDVLPIGSCLEVRASVRDVTSLRRVQGVTQTCFVSHACHINTTYLDAIVKPGLFYGSQVLLHDHQGQPVVGQVADVTMLQRRLDFSTVTHEISVSSDEDGFIRFSTPVAILSDTVLFSLTVSTTCSATVHKVLTVCQASQSCPGQLRVTSSSQGKAKVNNNIVARVQLNRKAREDVKVTILVVRDGSILKSLSKTLRENNTRLPVESIFVEPSWSPGFYLLVYTVCSDGGLTADSVYQAVEFYEENNVGFKFQDDRKVVVAGRENRPPMLEIFGSPGTTIYLLTVDQSVYLMNSTNRLTREKLQAEYGSKDVFARCHTFPSCKADYAFQKAGLSGFGPESSSEPNPICEPAPKAMAIEECCLLGEDSGADIPIQAFKRQFCEADISRSLGSDSNPTCVEVFMSCCTKRRIITGDQRRLRQNVQFNFDLLFARHYFKETIVNKYKLSGHSLVVPSFHLPHTITGWTMQGIATHPSLPLTIPKDFKFRTVKPFFLVLHLPSSLVHGEQFAMRVTLHSQSNQKKKASVYLTGGDQYCSVAGTSDRSRNATVHLREHGSVTLTYIITPLVVGNISIGVQAVTNEESLFLSAADSDYVSRSIRVKPRGVSVKTQCETIPIVVKGGRKIQFQFNLTTPKDHVYGTVRPVIKLLGSGLGHLSRLEGVEDMLEMPYGCGEQNMLRFSVNTYILRYLTRSCASKPRASAEPLHPYLRRKALNFMKEGYQRQLNFQREDGSFSPFGKRDEEGSTWLTAFVVKCFCAVDPSMRQQIPIDDEVVEKALKFLETKQLLESGGLVEDGRIIDGCIKGGGRTSTGIDNYHLTAFVAASLLECNRTRRHPLAGDIAARAIKYLGLHYEHINNAYDVALSSYALALAGESHFDPEIVTTKLETFSSVIDGATCDTRNQRTPRFYSRGCTGVYLETSAYAMLAQMTLGNTHKCGQCYVDWLLQWRKESGGFVSTQDTVMAIQAISEYMCCHTGDELRQDLNVTISAHSFRSPGKKEVKKYRIDEENRDLENLVSLSTGFKKGLTVAVNASGEGRATLQRCLKYNVERNEEHCNFTIAVRVRDGPFCTPNSNVQTDMCIVTLDISVGLHVTQDIEETGMVIVEVLLLSGFTIEPRILNSLKDVTDGLKRAERHGQTLLLYFDSLTKVLTSISIELQRTELMGLVQPAVIRVYDYYNPGISCHKFYHLRHKSAMLSVLCRDRACLCGSGECLERQERHPLGRLVYHIARKVCRNDYAWRVTVTQVKQLKPSNWVKVRGRVKAVIKLGERDIKTDQILTFYRPSHCDWPVLDVGTDYLITGNDRGVRLVLDRNTQIEKWNRSQRFCNFVRLMRNSPGICDAVDSIFTTWNSYKATDEFKYCSNRDLRP